MKLRRRWRKAAWRQLIQGFPDVCTGRFQCCFICQRDELAFRCEGAFRLTGLRFDIGLLAARIAGKGKQNIFANLSCQVQCVLFLLFTGKIWIHLDLP